MSMGEGKVDEGSLSSILSTLIQTKAPIAIAQKGLAGYLGHEEFDVAYKGLGRGQKLKGRLGLLASTWRDRTRPHSKADMASADPSERLDMQTENAMRSIVVSALVRSLGRKIVEELLARGIRVRMKGGELEFIPESERRVGFARRTRERQMIRSRLMRRGLPATEESIDRVLKDKRYKRMKKRALQGRGVRL
jgi:hypothetical protein